MANLVKQNNPDELNKRLKATIKGIDKELKFLGVDVAGNFTPKTNGTSFKMNENDSNTINILTTLDTSYLIKALSKMRRLKKETEDLMLELVLFTLKIELLL